MKLEIYNLQYLPKTFKFFLSGMLFVLGINYMMLLATIWFDTSWKIEMIVEGYGTFEVMELVHHSFQYLFWFFGTFSVMVPLFLISNAPEKLKGFFALFVPLFIITDISAAWFIRYTSFFAWVLYLSGFLLAISFLIMFIVIQKNLWTKKVKK